MDNLPIVSRPETEEAGDGHTFVSNAVFLLNETKKIAYTFLPAHDGKGASASVARSTAQMQYLT